MNIWLFQTGEPLPISKDVRKMRTAILADHLAERGHRILWWASAFEHQRKKWISDKEASFYPKSNYGIRVLCGIGYKKNVSLSRYFDHLMVARKFKLRAENFEAPDLIVASMPCYHMAYEAVLYALRHRVPILIDIRDLWPDIFIEPLKRFKLQKFGRLFLTRDFKKLRCLIRKADSLVAISKGCLNWALEKIGRPAGKWDRVFYHGYVRNSGESILFQNKSDSIWSGKKVFLFIGTFGKSYELDLIINVARRFNETPNNEIVFCLAGTGEQYNIVRKKAAQLSNVSLPGWMDAMNIQRLLQSAWAGMVPCKSVENAAPNKIFEYLSAKLPLISSLRGEVADLIDGYRLGLNYRAGDADDLQRCIEIISKDIKLHQKMSNAAFDFFTKYGDANKIYDEYATHIENLYDNFHIINN